MTAENSVLIPAVNIPGRNNLNFLRVLLATLVILSHSPEIIDGDTRREILTRVFHTLSFGQLAVDGFFILSGYLIVQSWLRNPNPIDYLRKRALRICPAFFVAYIFSVFVVGPLGAENVKIYFAHTPWRHFFTHLVMLNLPATSPTFVGLPYNNVNGPTWTIVYEFGCYLILMALGMIGLLRKRTLVAALFVLVLLAQLYVLRHTLHLAFPNPLIGSPLIWPRMLTFFLAGSCFYLFRDRIVYRPQWAWLALIISLIAMFNDVSALIVLPLCGAYALLYAGLHPIDPL